MDTETHVEQWRAQSFDSYQVLVDIGVPAMVAVEQADKAQFPQAK